MIIIMKNKKSLFVEVITDPRKKIFDAFKEHQLQTLKTASLCKHFENEVFKAVKNNIINILYDNFKNPI